MRVIFTPCIKLPDLSDLVILYSMPKLFYNTTFMEPICFKKHSLIFEDPRETMVDDLYFLLFMSE